MTYAEWAAKHPHAAIDLQEMHGATPWPTGEDNSGKSENWAQQQIRFQAFRAGAQAWRNNVGATPAKIKTTCPKCQNHYEIKQQPVRFGLANDSMKLNEVMKSSDVILAIPRLITQQHVGQTIAQFGSVEVKKPGWRYTGTEHEQAQGNWLALINGMGGYATFSTGELNL